MNKDLYIWLAIILATWLAGMKDEPFRDVLRWVVLIIVVADMGLYFLG